MVVLGKVYCKTCFGGTKNVMPCFLCRSLPLSIIVLNDRCQLGFLVFRNGNNMEAIQFVVLATTYHTKLCV